MRLRLNEVIDGGGIRRRADELFESKCKVQSNSGGGQGGVYMCVCV